jgi:hypothetical protein
MEYAASISYITKKEEGKIRYLLSNQNRQATVDTSQRRVQIGL